MIKAKENKGITLISLIVTIVILLILGGTVAYRFSVTNDTATYNKMIADIKVLSDKILIYFNKYGGIPRTDRTITIEEITYYEIDLSKLDNLTLNFGDDYNKTGELTTSSDVYTVNDNLDVYFLKGVEKSDEIYHAK